MFERLKQWWGRVRGSSGEPDTGVSWLTDDQEEIERREVYENDQFHAMQNAAHSIQVEVDTIPFIADVFQTMYLDSADDRTRSAVLETYAENFGGDIEQARVLICGERAGLIDDMRLRREAAERASRFDRLTQLLELLPYEDLQKAQVHLTRLLDEKAPEPEDRPTVWEHLK